MCPACIASAALMIVGTASTGSLAALAMSRFFRVPGGAEENKSEFKQKENGK